MLRNAVARPAKKKPERKAMEPPPSTENTQQDGKEHARETRKLAKHLVVRG